MNYLVSNAALMATVKQQKQRIAELEAALGFANKRIADLLPRPETKPYKPSKGVDV